MTDRDICVIQRYAEDILFRLACNGYEYTAENCVEWDEERDSVKISVPHDADHILFCDMLAQALHEAGHSEWDVWCDHWTPSYVYVADKAGKEDSE